MKGLDSVTVDVRCNVVVSGLTRGTKARTKRVQTRGFLRFFLKIFIRSLVREGLNFKKAPRGTRIRI